MVVRSESWMFQRGLIFEIPLLKPSGVPRVNLIPGEVFGSGYDDGAYEGGE